MSFLAPLYLLAALAIGLPIAFHLIRRTPQGRQVFSSLMFLNPSPPRMTRRRWLEDWLLMLLRVAAVLALAFAFARPFLQTVMTAVSEDPNEEILILVDRSASMQRPGYWDRALEQVRLIAQKVGPRDSLQLQMFDTSFETLLSFAEWDQLAPGVRVQTVQDRLRESVPGWSETETGKVLLEATGQFRSEAGDASIRQRLVLVSDLQAGGGWEALSASVWPEQIRLQVLDVSQPGESNASIHLATDPRNPTSEIRVRLSNTANSLRDSLTLQWKDPFTTEAGNAANDSGERVYVPAGQSRMMAPPVAPVEGLRGTLQLSGDDVVFDNLCYVAGLQPRKLTIVYAGDEPEDDSSQGLRFFLSPAFPKDATRTVQIIPWAPGQAAPDILDQSPDWVIIGKTLSPAQRDWLKSWLQQGGEALFVARDAAQGQSVFDLLSLPSAPVEEGAVRGHALLGKVNLDHTVMRQFRDPRFSDFTKLRFWKYRRFDAATLPRGDVIAEFEEGSPALVEFPVGQGRLVLLASGWNRDDSDLAVWSKFVPLMNTLLEQACRIKGISRQWEVGDQLELAQLGFKTESVTIRTDGQTVTHPGDSLFQFTRPGLYRFAVSEAELAGPDSIIMAVNLPPAESRTEPYPVELLAAAGIPLEEADQPLAQIAARAQFQRQLLQQELEARQQWWRWLLWTALVLVGLESVLGVWKGRRQTAAAT